MSKVKYLHVQSVAAVPHDILCCRTVHRDFWGLDISSGGNLGGASTALVAFFSSRGAVVRGYQIAPIIRPKAILPVLNNENRSHYLLVKEEHMQ